MRYNFVLDGNFKEGDNYKGVLEDFCRNLSEHKFIFVVEFL